MAVVRTRRAGTWGLARCSGRSGACGLSPRTTPKILAQSVAYGELATLVALPSRARSSREQLPPDVLEGLELECIAGRIEQEHRRLFAGLSLEPDGRLDLEPHTVLAQPLGQPMPLRHLEYRAAMRDRHAVAVDGVVVGGDPAVLAERRIQVADELVTEQVEVDPVRVAASLAAAEHVRVEPARLVEVAYLHGDVKGRQRHGELSGRARSTPRRRRARRGTAARRRSRG